MTSEAPSIELLRETFRYDPETGHLIWLPRGRNLTGLVAGGVDPGHGYIRVRIGGKLYLAHRVALAITNGAWPEGQVDHINGVRSDNRLVNLRAVTRAVNLRNKAKYRSNTSGVTGVFWHKQHRKWCASICKDGKPRTLGVFVRIEDAIAARRAAEVQNQFHPNHGRNAA